MTYQANQARALQARPVVVTGVGIVSPMGAGITENASGFRAGKTAFRQVEHFDVTTQRTKTAGVTQDVSRPTQISERSWHRMDRGTRLATMAASEALADANVGHRKLPMIVGTSAGAMPIGESYFRHACDGARRGQFLRVECYQPQRQMSTMMRELGIYGPLRIVSNACASGANTIGHAFQLVREGRADRVLAGGYDALAQMVFAGFDSLQALTPSGIPRPFDRARDGLAIGEGAGFVVVESLESAKSRRAHIHAHLLGYGAATDIHHLTQPDPDGDAALMTMTQATRMAGLEPGQIDYLNSHGTGTPLNDVAEAAAIRRWAGDNVEKIRVSSTKSSIGHLLGGAGAVEAVICLIALAGQWLPANLNVREIDPAVEFDLVTSPRDATVAYALTNSFGFGGSNATLVLGKEAIS